jgi:endonuclease/exonuclease/phosphatase family metal-dependent hydrolase
MPPFVKPKFPFAFNVQEEIAALNNYKKTKPGRSIPAKAKNRLLLATWNIANLGAQDRTDDHYAMIAEILSWYDLIALQEVKSDLSGLRKLVSFLPSEYKLVFTDIAGNDERMAFVFDSKKLKLLEMIGELSVPASDVRLIKLPNINIPFVNFDRNPFVVAFEAGALRFACINVHLYFGQTKTKVEEQLSMDRRCLEAFAVGRYVDIEQKSKTSYVDKYFALGDFNLPKAVHDDPVFNALTNRGLEIPSHSTKIFSNIMNDADYDQIAFLPGMDKLLTENKGVFDYDGAVFAKLFSTKTLVQFNSYLRYYMSDHRPMWMEIKID